MYREHSIALVIPAYNEAKLIRPTLENVPSLFDRVSTIFLEILINLASLKSWVSF